MTQPVKDAIDTLVSRRAADTGDDSITGWFLAMVHREAKRADVEIQTAPEPAPVRRRTASKSAPKKRAGRSS